MAVFRAGEVEKALDQARELVQEFYDTPVELPNLENPETIKVCAFCGMEIQEHKPRVVWECRDWHLKCAWAMLD